MQDDKALRLILRQARTIAVIGAKDKPEQPVDRVGRYLLEQGYRLFPVHPVRTQVWGLPVFATVTEIQEPIDIVVLFRASHFCPTHAAEVADLATPPSVFWMQTGIRSPESRRILSNSNIMVVEDACIMVEHARLMGNKDQGCAHGS